MDPGRVKTLAKSIATTLDIAADTLSRVTRVHHAPAEISHAMRESDLEQIVHELRLMAVKLNSLAEARS